MNQTIRAKIRPFQSDNRIADIVSRINALRANLHGLNASLVLPVQPVRSQYPMQVKKWRTSDMSIASRAKKKPSMFSDDIKPSGDIMRNMQDGYQGGIDSIL